MGKQLILAVSAVTILSEETFHLSFVSFQRFNAAVIMGMVSSKKLVVYIARHFMYAPLQIY